MRLSFIRRSLGANHQERLTRIKSISPLAFSAGAYLLRAAVRAGSGKDAKLTTGPFHPLDADWGARVGCYVVVGSGLRNAERCTTPPSICSTLMALRLPGGLA